MIKLQRTIKRKCPQRHDSYYIIMFPPPTYRMQSYFLNRNQDIKPWQKSARTNHTALSRQNIDRVSPRRYTVPIIQTSFTWAETLAILGASTIFTVISIVGGINAVNPQRFDADGRATVVIEHVACTNTEIILNAGTCYDRIE